MPKKRHLHPRPLLDQSALLAFFRERGWKEPSARRLVGHFVRDGTRVAEVDGLPRDAYEELGAHFAEMTSVVESESWSSDGSTTKLLVRLADGHRIETVVIRNHHGGSARSDATVCVSSQVGCQMGCTFCATGTMGLLANLSAGEILEQLVHARRYERVRAVVFMGMGEPLANCDAVLEAIEGAIDTQRFGVSPDRCARARGVWSVRVARGGSWRRVRPVGRARTRVPPPGRRRPLRLCC